MDAVITYVNGSDKLWQIEYNKYVKHPIEESRYRDWGTLPYIIQGIRKFMPFIDKIFLVISGASQIPEGIDLTDVKIVYHNMIIPERYLPCFNSRVIELFFHKIEGLSEKFIYFNDDMFVLKPMKETDFFIGDLPVLNPHLISYTHFDNFTSYQSTCKNSTELIRNTFAHQYPAGVYIKQEHIMRPMLKSTYEKVWEKCENVILKKMTRIRDQRNYNIYLFNDYDVMTSQYIQKELSYKYIRTTDSLVNIVKYITSGKFDTICLNDNGDINFENKDIILSAFDNAINGTPFTYVDETVYIEEDDLIDTDIINKPNNFKKVVYTCITGNYDNLLEPQYITPGFDYICFTDDINLKSKVWKIYPIPDEVQYLSKVKQQRNIKINAHKYLPQYDLSIWVDSSVKLHDNLNNILRILNFNDYNIFITKHPQRNCIYKEGDACIKLKKDTEEIINNELNFFKETGMPENYGLLETNVMIRLHNEESCIKLMEKWWEYVKMYSHRDQLALPYCLWKLKYDRICKMGTGFNHTSYFNWISGLHKKTNICIIHYNTPELTEALIKSINKYMKRVTIYLFDNSTTKPYPYRYDNMIYLDNTQGQYINFDEWLETYPTRLQSKECIGNYGSARHSISVEKCMEIIDENFILMDSDILLKQDVSKFVNNKAMYVGQSIQQKNGLYRVAPFCLFINVDMCRKYGVHWFDANYMHGLHITKESDRYDTGGAFYVHTRKYPKKEVNLDNFIVHYKGGSWEERHMKKYGLTLTSKEWLQINKKYWE